MIDAPEYGFLRELGGILNSGQSRAVFLSGATVDLFYIGKDDGASAYLPLIDFLIAQWGETRGKILLVYELNGPIRFLREDDRAKLSQGWSRWRTGLDSDDLAIRKMLMNSRERAQLEQLGGGLEVNLKRAYDSPSVALELLRQMCICSRSTVGGKPCLDEDLIILIEGADLLLPQGEIGRLSDSDRHRVAVCSDWFSDPGFTDGADSVVLLTESKSLVNPRVARLPQVLEVQVPSPGQSVREHCIAWFDGQQRPERKLRLWSTQEQLGRLTAGLSVHALIQLLKGASHRQNELTPADVITQVERHVKQELGDDVVSFKKPEHTLDDVVGFGRLKTFLRGELIPRFKSTGLDALAGAAVCGPIGVGKTFIFEAVASELDIVVLVLKNIRSKWFGETDVVFERLRRVVQALAKVVIFVDEADTQFGDVGEHAHATERRLTGKIQAMMSDTKLRGRVIWLLMTARIHLLSADIRRPGRVGDLIIPVLDPKGEERREFCQWMVDKVVGEAIGEAGGDQLLEATADFSAATYASLRSELRAKAISKALNLEEVLAVVGDHIPPAIGEVRRYQTLQALLNCTRRSLLPDPGVSSEQRLGWAQEVRRLEAAGIR